MKKNKMFEHSQSWQGWKKNKRSRTVPENKNWVGLTLPNWVGLTLPLTNLNRTMNPGTGAAGGKVGGGRHTCALLTDVGEVVVAGNVIPAPTLMCHHHHTVLPASEEIVWLVLSPVLILLQE